MNIPTNTPDKPSRHYMLIGSVLVGLILAGGGMAYLSGDATASEEKQQQPSAPEVEIMVVRQEPVRVWHDFSGRLQAVDRVDIRPQVSGVITKILFEEGAQVKKGASLFEIDPRPYEAELQSAKAALDSANSQVGLAKAELHRAEKLVEKNIVTKSRYDMQNNTYKTAQANVKAAQARLERAKLDVEFSHITAPVSGKVSRAELTEGNLVSIGSNAPVLTTIVAHDTLYADFDVDEQTYVRMMRRQHVGVKNMPVKLHLAQDDSVLYDGVIDSFDNRLDPRTGTIRARAIIYNTDGALIAGMFATVSLGAATEESMLLVEDKAVSTDQDKKYVYVIGDDNKVAYREIRLGRSIDAMREVISGLNDGDQVMVNSLQRVQPGMQVQPITSKPQEHS